MDKTSKKRLYKFELYVDGVRHVQGEGRDFETLSFFLSKTNDNVLGIRFFTDNKGCLKITKRPANTCCCAMALIRDYKQYLGKYKLINSENHVGYKDCLFEKSVGRNK